uniref:Uncharacterized protein n=1 Tax=Tanacetum cinerariifolium TaxID=118510 RepID=A0A699GU83_TANCI|nr:hypothetical protein [Tanacetum cinerariifolium]
MIGCEVMRTLASVEIEIMLILGLPCCLSSSSVRCLESADGAQSSRVPVPLPEDPYEAIRQAYLVGTDTESEPFEDLFKTETLESPHVVAPPTCHVEESEASGTSGARSTSSDSTAPLLPDHPLTHTTPDLVPILRRNACMAVRVPPVMLPGLSTGIAKVAAMSDSAFRKRVSEEDEEVDESLDFDSESKDAKDEGPIAEDENPTARDEGLTARDEGLTTRDEGPGIGVESHGLDDEIRGLDDECHSVESDGFGLGDAEALPRGQQQAALVMGTAVSVPLGLGYGALRCRELALEGDHVYSTFEVGQGSGSVPEPERSKRVPASRKPILATWTDPKDGMVYIDVPGYPPPVSPPQTPPSPEWSSGSFPISQAPSIVRLPISSPMISLTVPSPIASNVATSTATIPVDEDQFIVVGAQLELYRSILQDHTQRLDVMQPTLFAEIDRDRPVLALDAWAGRVDSWMTDMSRAGYDDHRLVHDMLLQQTALQRELREMGGRITTLEQERDHMER